MVDQRVSFSKYLFKKVLSISCGLFLMIVSLYFAYDQLIEHDWRYKTMSQKDFTKYKISKNTSLDLYQLMKDVHETLDKYKIDYWIEGGTLLGAVRHGGVIPFDDDLDINIDHRDELRLQEIFPELEKLGYTILHNLIYRICKKNGPCMDVFIMHNREGKILLTNLIARAKFVDDYFLEGEIYPLKKYKFGELEIWGPKNYKNYLDRQYPEWDRYATIQQPHGWYVWISNVEKKTKFTLSDEFLKPSMPTGPLTDRVK